MINGEHSYSRKSRNKVESKSKVRDKIESRVKIREYFLLLKQVGRTLGRAFRIVKTGSLIYYL